MVNLIGTDKHASLLRNYREEVIVLLGTQLVQIPALDAYIRLG